ncbi:MAG: hypothetical protein KatS3mg043_0765 [Rhodothermaceae bacterium]|nr:MAG: hypothetical protein KatS3mg043_0765 [Rhodothermaceae bacterium]
MTVATIRVLLVLVAMWFSSPASMREAGMLPASGGEPADSAGTAVRSPRPAAGPWPMFRHDAARTGRTGNLGPQQPALAWSYALIGPTFSSPAVGADGAIYIGSATQVYALHADGTLRWATALDAPALSSPALTEDGMVYIGSLDETIYGLDAAAGTPTPASFAAGSEVWSSPAVGPDGTVYVAAFDGTIYAVAPGGNVPRAVCHLDGDVVASPAVGPDGTVYAGSLDGHLYACRPDQSRQAWFLQGDVVASPAIGPDGTVYAGAFDGTLYALRPGSDTPVPCQVTGGRIVASPAIGPDGTVYVASFDGHLYAVAPNCTLRWRFPVGAPVTSSPAVDAEGVAYFGAFDGRLYAVGPDGSARWSFPTGHDVVWSSPALGSDRTLYVAATDTTGARAHLLAIASTTVRVDAGDATAGTSVRLQVSRFDGRPAGGTLYFRPGGARTYQPPIPITNGMVEIPGPFVTARGLEYWIELGDGTTFPPRDPRNRPAVLPVRVGTLEPPVPPPPRAYRMVSVPLVLDAPGTDAVLADDYGPYDRARWRLLRWSPARNAYVEHPETGEGFTPGTAFFLITADGQPFGTGSGHSVDTSTPYTLSLPPNAWTQVGNPFAFRVAWDEVRFEPDVINRNEIYAFDGEFVAAPGRTPWMEPWTGYFIRNDSDEPVRMIIPPHEATGETTATGFRNSPPGGPVVRLQARGPGAFRDTWNWIGLLPGATVGRDPFDFLEPPPVEPSLRLSIVEEGRRYAGNFKPLQEPGQAWDIEVVATEPSLPIEFEIDTEQPLPDGFRIYVVDRQTGRFLPAGPGGFRLSPEAGEPYLLRILIGTEAFAADPAHRASTPPGTFALEPNHPNPFQDATTIRYRLHARHHVELVIFDVLGREVIRLVDRAEPPGTYAVTWDGLDHAGARVPAGVYLYRLKAGPSAEIRTMLRLR